MTEISKKTIIHTTKPKEYITQYWHKRAEDFSHLRSEELRSDKYRLWQNELSRHMPPDKSLKILDIGCGAGFFSILLSEKGHQVTGIDLTPDMIKAAQKLAYDKHLNIDFQVMDAEKLTFADGSFDAIIARNLTWNLPDPATAYKEWLRVLKKGGILLNYDAEYAKNHHSSANIGAHAHVQPELLRECHNIYHMLDISCYDRPDWDMKFLTGLNCREVTADKQVGERIYARRDEFYIPVPMFCIRAVK